MPIACVHRLMLSKGHMSKHMCLQNMSKHMCLQNSEAPWDVGITFLKLRGALSLSEALRGPSAPWLWPLDLLFMQCERGSGIVQCEQSCKLLHARRGFEPGQTA